MRFCVGDNLFLLVYEVLLTLPTAFKMNYKSILPVIFCVVILCITSSLYAQEYVRCVTTEVLDQYEQQEPGTKTLVEQAREWAAQWRKDHPEATRTVITVPVVVHVIYHTSSQNITDEQVKSQIDVLNEDYRLANADTSKIPDEFKPVAADCQIQFCLAAYDPNGDTTTAITHVYTDVTSFSTGDSMKFTAKGGEDAWPAKDYLNIWTCNLSNKVLGYATLPTFSSGVPPKNDGVVVLYRAFGREGYVVYPYNLGRTCTHEVGHWLGMYHIWGDDGGGCDGSDDMDDTPNQADANYGCPSFPKTDACSPNPPGVMFMDYMDYTDDRCMYMFTKDQAAEMTSVLNTSRKSIQTSPAGCAGTHFGNDAAAAQIIQPLDTLDYLSFQPQVSIINRGLMNLTSVDVNYQVDGQDPAVYHFTGNLLTNESEMVTLPWYFTGEGDHISTAWTSNPNNATDEYIYNDTTTRNFTIISIIAKNSFVTYPSPTNGALTINIENPGAGNMDMRIVNILGQVVQHHFSQLGTQTSFTVDLSDVSPGTYFLFAKIGYDYLTRKIMVVR